MEPVPFSPAWFAELRTEHGLKILALIFATMGLAFFVRGFRELQRRRFILDTPRSKIRSAALGLVEINGVAVGPRTITAPITDRSAFCCRTVLESLGRFDSDRGDNGWTTVVDERRDTFFYLQDDTGMMLIDPAGAELDIHQDYQAEHHDFLFVGEEGDRRIVEFAARHNISANTGLRATQYCIKPHNALYVLGTLKTFAGQWQAALPAHDVSIATTPGMFPEQNIAIVGKGENDPTFFISWRSRRDLVRELRWQSVLAVFGGGSLAVATIAFLVWSFGAF